MDDWAVALISVGGPLAGAAGAVGAGWVSGRFGVAQAQTQAQGELKRLEEEHAEDERRHRQGVYHNLLVALGRYDNLTDDFAWDVAAKGEPDAAEQLRMAEAFVIRMKAVRDEAEALLLGVRLFAPLEVREAAHAVLVALHAYDDERLQQILQAEEWREAPAELIKDGQIPFWSKLVKTAWASPTYKASSDSIQALRAAMERDVGPM